MLPRLLNRMASGAWARGELASAEALFRTSLRLQKSGTTLSNLGALLMERHAFEEGFRLLLQAAEMEPDDAGVQVNLANAYHRGGRSDLARDFFRRALTIDPCCREASLNLTRVLLEMCDWDGIDEVMSSIRARRRAEGVLAWDWVAPYTSLFLEFDGPELREIAQRYASTTFGAVSGGGGGEKPGKNNGRVRLGYLSSDFHDHPTAHLSLGIYGGHDRGAFQVYGYSIGYPDDGRHRRRIEQDCDVFRDVSCLSDRAVAAQIREDQIDVLIDLKGYTGGGRPGIIAMRPAPVQISYLGYPGTMGVSCIDYLIADPVVVPQADFVNYTERVLWLPNSYQPTDDEQVVGFSSLGRLDYGLPEDSFVYCCFNNSVKIDRRTFSAWMRVLLAVQGSVLWLLRPPDAAILRLQSEMKAMGVDPARLKFAPAVPKSEHLARLKLADLTLDTFVYNAHTTATDSLWAGVPVVTLIGRTFASRVAASLLSACGLKDLIAQTEADFVKLAVRLAEDAEFRSHVKQTLLKRRRMPLFDTTRYVRDLDTLLLDVWRSDLAGTRPP